MNKMFLLGLVCFGLHTAAFAETAEEANVQQSINALLGGDAVRSVRAAPMPGLYLPRNWKSGCARFVEIIKKNPISVVRIRVRCSESK